ncbi:hypothetical protein ACJX0J_041465, partial [Zea mays]
MQDLFQRQRWMADIAAFIGVAILYVRVSQSIFDRFILLTIPMIVTSVGKNLKLEVVENFSECVILSVLDLKTTSNYDLLFTQKRYRDVYNPHHLLCLGNVFYLITNSFQLYQYKYLHVVVKN